MAITTHWLPYHLQLHSGLRSLQPCNPSGRYVVLLRARDAKGEILQEHRLNHGDPITGASYLHLDFSVLEASMTKAVAGLVEATFSSEEPFAADGYNYYIGLRGFTLFANGPQLAFNQSNKPHRYRGFSVHLIDPAVQTCGLVLMNVSTDLHYSRAASFQYEVLDKKGEIVQAGSREILPFGTCWLPIEESVLRNHKETMVTMFGRCEGSALISLIYNASEGGGIGIDHTAPAVFQSAYGEDMTPGLRHRYLRMRERLNRKMRYCLNRFE